MFTDLFYKEFTYTSYMRCHFILTFISTHLTSLITISWTGLIHVYENANECKVVFIK